MRGVHGEQAYRLGAMDSKELSLSAKETKAVLSGTHARLLLPLVLPHGDFQDERKAQVHTPRLTTRGQRDNGLRVCSLGVSVKADRFSSICQVILSNLKLDIYGQLTIGTMTFTRKVIYIYQTSHLTSQAPIHFGCVVCVLGRSPDYRRSWRHLHGGKTSSSEGAPQVTAAIHGNHDNMRVGESTSADMPHLVGLSEKLSACLVWRCQGKAWRSSVMGCWWAAGLRCSRCMRNWADYCWNATTRPSPRYLALLGQPCLGLSSGCVDLDPFV